MLVETIAFTPAGSGAPLPLTRFNSLSEHEADGRVPCCHVAGGARLGVARGGRGQLEVAPQLSGAVDYCLTCLRTSIIRSTTDFDETM